MNRRRKRKAIDKLAAEIAGREHSRITAREGKYLRDEWPKEVVASLWRAMELICRTIGEWAVLVREVCAGIYDE